MSNRLLTLFFFLLLGPLSISYAEDTNDNNDNNDNNVVIIGSKAINIDNWEVVDLPPKLIQTKQPEVIFAPIAGKMRVVGELNPDHGFYAYNPNGSYNALQFGNDYAYIKTAQLSNKKPRNLPSDDRLNDLQNPVYDYLITTQKTPVYAGMKENSPQIASLWEDLRYPVLARMINTDNDGEKTAWLTIRLGDRLGYIRLDDVSIDKGIPILTYHHILEDSENKNFRHTSTTTSVAAFREQMDYLKEQGYQTISLDDVEGYLEKKANLPGKAVALTFDDGLKSVYRYALPILRNNQQQATLFVISSRVKTKPQQWNPDSLQFMCKQEIKDSQDVFNIQSHTHFLHRLDNRNNPIIFSRKEHTIMLDFKRSMKELAKFEPNQRALAYPFGAYNQTAIQAGKEAGLRLAVTTIQGKVRLGDNPFALKRLYAYSTDPISKFALMVGNGEETVVNKNVVVDK